MENYFIKSWKDKICLGIDPHWLWPYALHEHRQDHCLFFLWFQFPGASTNCIVFIKPMDPIRKMNNRSWGFSIKLCVCVCVCVCVLLLSRLYQTLRRRTGVTKSIILIYEKRIRDWQFGIKGSPNVCVRVQNGRGHSHFCTTRKVILATRQQQ